MCNDICTRGDGMGTGKNFLQGQVGWTKFAGWLGMAEIFCPRAQLAVISRNHVFHCAVQPTFPASTNSVASNWGPGVHASERKQFQPKINKIWQPENETSFQSAVVAKKSISLYSLPCADKLMNRMTTAMRMFGRACWRLQTCKTVLWSSDYTEQTFFCGWSQNSLSSEKYFAMTILAMYCRALHAAVRGTYDIYSFISPKYSK